MQLATHYYTAPIHTHTHTLTHTHSHTALQLSLEPSCHTTALISADSTVVQFNHTTYTTHTYTHTDHMDAHLFVRAADG